MHVTDWLLKDKHGKVAVMQAPNIPLWGFIICRLLGLFIKQHTLHHGLQQLGTAFIFLWAYLEITSGYSNFRKILGAIVMLLIVSSFFRS